MGKYNKSNEIESVRTHLITLYANAENIIYFDCLRVEYIPKEIRKFIGNKDITNIYRILCGYFFRGFFDFMTKVRSF